MRARSRMAWQGLAVLMLCVAGVAFGQSPHLAPGFAKLPKDTRVLLMPTDIELFEISAGGVLEPKAEWTQDATKHFRAALAAKQKTLGATVIELAEQDVDNVAEINSLHAAVANAITLHHYGTSSYRLRTKDGKLDWSLGDAVRVLKEKTAADYALFTWVRDSYASGGRIASTVVLALLGVVSVPGGRQVGYASLVDLNTGQVQWFNRLARSSGDLREAGKAADTLDALLAQFPSAQ